MSIGNYVPPLFIGVVAVEVLKESITPLMVAGVILLSTIVATVYESEILARLARTTRRYFDVQPPSTGSVTPVT